MRNDKFAFRKGPLACLVGGLILTVAIATSLVAGSQEAAPRVAASRTVAADATTKVTVIPVEGMSCGSCAASIKGKLKSITGVTQAEISLEQRNALVHYDSGQLTPEKLVQAIDELGYKAGKPTAPNR